MQECLYHHPVHKISFIAQDMSDSRAFGYIFGSPDTGHRFFGIKTDKAANQVSIKALMGFHCRQLSHFDLDIASPLSKLLTEGCNTEERNRRVV